MSGKLRSWWADAEFGELTYTNAIEEAKRDLKNSFFNFRLTIELLLIIVLGTACAFLLTVVRDRTSEGQKRCSWIIVSEDR
jgi:hypothetical protein